MTLIDKESGDLELEPSIGQLVQEATESLSTIIRGEIELAKLELRGSVKNGGVGVGFFGAAAALVLLALPFIFITLAEILIAIGLPRWSGYAIITLFFFLLAGLFAFLGYRKVKRVRPPRKAIETGKETAAYLKTSRQR